MASPKPIKEVKEKITVKPQSVKVVKPASSFERDIRNIMATGKALGAKEGTVAKREAARVEMRNSGTKPAVVSVRSNAGISGTGGAKVAPIYKPMGGSGLGLLSIKNK